MEMGKESCLGILSDQEKSIYMEESLWWALQIVRKLRLDIGWIPTMINITGSLVNSQFDPTNNKAFTFTTTTAELISWHQVCNWRNKFIYIKIM